MLEIEITDELDKSMFQDHQDQFAREISREVRAWRSECMLVKLSEFQEFDLVVGNRVDVSILGDRDHKFHFEIFNFVCGFIKKTVRGPCGGSGQ